MRGYLLIAGAVACAGASVTSAAVTVLGKSAARGCYEAAEQARFGDAQMAVCDAAVAEGTETNRNLVASYVNRGIVRRLAHMNVEATADFDRAIALDPKEPEAWLNKALIRVSGADDAAARESVALFDAAIERKTGRPALAYYGRGLAQELSGNVGAAYRDYRRAAELAPEWQRPQEDLARFKVTAAPASGGFSRPS